MAMRHHLPSDILAFTVNRLMYEQLCALDESSFFIKIFGKDLFFLILTSFFKKESLSTLPGEQ